MWNMKCFVIDYDGVRLCLRTAATNGPIFHFPGDMWAWRAMVMVTPAGDNSWLFHQNSMAVFPVETSGASRRNGRRSENFAYQYLKYVKGYLTYRKILRNRTSGFTAHPKKGVLRICITLKNSSPRLGLNLQPLGPVTSTLTTTPPRRLLCHISNHWGHRNCKQKFTKISGNNTRTTLNRFPTKTAILGTSHIIRKVLQAETWSLSDGVHLWLKRRSTRKKKTCDKRT
jgi:hypothetical protein